MMLSLDLLIITYNLHHENFNDCMNVRVDRHLMAKDKTWSPYQGSQPHICSHVF